MASQPIIVAHRGLHAHAPENSSTAFHLALRAGVPWIECDLWPTANGGTVILHDPTLDRTTTGSGPVSEKRWDELHGLRLRAPDGQIDPQARLWSLDDLVGLTRCSGGPGLFVEIKPADAPHLVHQAVEILSTGCQNWLLQSFDAANLIHALSVDIHAPLALLVADRPALERGIADGWKRIHLCHDLLDADTAARLSGADISIGVWTVNSITEMQRVLALDVNALITDQPVDAMKLVRFVHASRDRERAVGGANPAAC